MGIKGGSRGNNYGFGNLVSLNPVNDSKPKAININKKLIPKTRTIKISEQLYKKIKEHSSRCYNIESYETILTNLLNFWDQHNSEYQHFDRY